VKRVGLWGVVLTFVVVFVGSFVSFAWLPHAQLNAPSSLFSAFCIALGIPQAPRRVVTVVRTPHSDVVLTHDLMQPPQLADIGHGATLALRCTPCHGPTGISYANSPNLAGQYAAVIYKQLRDYKSGVRTNSVMNPMAVALSDADMRQLAAYYSSLNRPAASQLTAEPPPIVKWGAPMRNVAPCGSCHGGIDHTAASPWLNGEPAAYLRGQLDAFVAGSRTNDINGQMRAMARGLTADEIASAATFYAGGSVSP
jgi:cytochrome c553